MPTYLQTTVAIKVVFLSPQFKALLWLQKNHTSSRLMMALVSWSLLSRKISKDAQAIRVGRLLRKFLSLESMLLQLIVTPPLLLMLNLTRVLTWFCNQESIIWPTLSLSTTLIPLCLEWVLLLWYQPQANLPWSSVTLKELEFLASSSKLVFKILHLYSKLVRRVMLVTRKIPPFSRIFLPELVVPIPLTKKSMLTSW